MVTPRGSAKIFETIDSFFCFQFAHKIKNRKPQIGHRPKDTTKVTMLPQQVTSSTTRRANKKRPPVFPKRLYDMLENAERDGYSHIISWMPDGKSFKVHADGSLNEQDEKAVVEILKRAFNQTRFKSFLRQLQLYGFERIYKGPRKGECKHEFFVRGRRDLFHKKSIEDFQRKANDHIRRPASVQNIFVAPEPTQVTSAMLAAIPMCKPLTRIVSSEAGTTANGCSGCSYRETTTIPTKLFNLILPDSDNSSVEQETDEDSNVFSLPERRDSLISINSGEDVPYSWTGMELQILQSAL